MRKGSETNTPFIKIDSRLTKDEKKYTPNKNDGFV
jgi:hypothetical protein